MHNFEAIKARKEENLLKVNNIIHEKVEKVDNPTKERKHLCTSEIINKDTKITFNDDFSYMRNLNIEHLKEKIIQKDIQFEQLCEAIKRKDMKNNITKEGDSKIIDHNENTFDTINAIEENKQENNDIVIEESKEELKVEQDENTVENQNKRFTLLNSIYSK